MDEGMLGPGGHSSGEDEKSSSGSALPVRSPAGLRKTRGHSLIVIVVVVIVLVAGGLGSYYLLQHQSRTGNGVVDDGPTLYQALGSVNASVGSLSGGPWILSQLYGIASPVPVNPSTWGWGEYDRTLRSCQSDFNGLTIWNGTLPLFTGSFNSGTAPFWQLVYFSNSSQQLLVATDVLGTVHVYPPIALSSTCATQSGLGYEPWVWKSFWGTDGFPENTPIIAGNDWASAAERYVSWLGRPVAELYLFGATQFGSGMSPSNQINFFTCGTVGAAGVTRGLAMYGSSGASSFNYTLGCTPTTDSWTAIPLELKFFNATAGTSASGSIVRQQFQFQLNGSPPYSGPGYNTGGVTSWMIDLNLTAPSGHLLPVAPSGCTSWLPSVADCAASGSGWYAVLLAPDGAWEGSYGATSNGPNWSYPVLPIANNETFAVVAPSTWNVSGDTLDVTSTTPELPLSGSVTFA